MAKNAIFYVVLVLACVITIYFLITGVIYPISSPNLDEVGVVNNTSAYVFVHTMITVKGLQNTTTICPASNYTFWTANNSVLMKGGTYCRTNMEYTINYDYRNDPTVLGTNFGFIVILLGVAMLLVALKAFKKW